MRLFALIFVFFGFVSQAMAESYTSCSNGKFEDVGDAYYEINLYEDGIEFLPYESSFTLDAADIGYENGTFSIINKTTELTAEGQKSTILVNAILILNAASTKLDVAISTDRGPFQSYAMTCVQK